MHYRPLSFLGVSSGQDLLSRGTYTHTHTFAGRGHVDLSAGRTRLDFQYGFVLQHSTLSLRPPVSVNVISLVLLLPECCLSLIPSHHHHHHHPASFLFSQPFPSELPPPTSTLFSSQVKGPARFPVFGLIHFPKCSVLWLANSLCS